MKMKCMIVDDEELAIRVLKSYIDKVPFLELMATATSPMEAMETLRNAQIDLVFLDIEMPELTGLDLVRSLQDPPAFIFVTAYREYAADAFDLESVDYLLKPVSFPRFLRAVNKYRMQKRDMRLPVDTRIHLRADRKTYNVDIGSIQYIEGFKDYVRIYLGTGEMIIVKETMTALQEQLSPFAFIRCHKSYIVSSLQIRAFSTEFIEIGNKQIPIGRSYKTDVLDLLGQE